MTSIDYLFALANMLVCVWIFSICTTRLGKMSVHYNVHPRVRYVAIGVGAVAVMLSPYSREFHGLFNFIFYISVLVSLLSDKARWKHGAPREYHKEHEPCA